MLSIHVELEVSKKKNNDYDRSEATWPKRSRDGKVAREEVLPVGKVLLMKTFKRL